MEQAVYNPDVCFWTLPSTGQSVSRSVLKRLVRRFDAMTDSQVQALATSMLLHEKKLGWWPENITAAEFEHVQQTYKDREVLLKAGRYLARQYDREEMHREFDRTLRDFRTRCRIEEELGRSFDSVEEAIKAHVEERGY